MPETRRGNDGDELSRSLRALREGAGADQIGAAKAAGVSQPKLSRAERGKALLSPEEVRALARFYRAPARECTRLVRLAKDAQAGHVDARVILQGGAHHFQQRIASLEETSALVRSFQATTMLGVLQTEAYASLVFGDDPESVAARTARGRQLVSGKWRLLMTEGALRWTAGSTAVMAEQLDHVADASRLPNVRLGIIGWGTPARVFPGEAFHIYDNRAVLVGIETGSTIMQKSDHIAAYADLFRRLEKLAVYDEQARALLGRIAAEYRASGR